MIGKDEDRIILEGLDWIGLYWEDWIGLYWKDGIGTDLKEDGVRTEVECVLRGSVHQIQQLVNTHSIHIYILPLYTLYPCIRVSLYI